MAALVTLATAKRHLNVTTDADNTDIYSKVVQASELILSRCNSTAYWRAITPTWTDLTVPAPVQAAVLVLLTHLYEHRGDDPATDKEVWDAIERLIVMHKDHVIA